MNVKSVLFNDVTCTARTDPEFIVQQNHLLTQLYQNFA